MTIEKEEILERVDIYEAFKSGLLNVRQVVCMVPLQIGQHTWERTKGHQTKDTKDVHHWEVATRTI